MLAREMLEFFGFKRFIKKVKSTLRDQLSIMMRRYDNSTSAKWAVDSFAQYIAEAAACEVTEVMLYAQQVIFDLCEIYNDLFGRIDPMEVLTGYGSSQCYLVCKNNGYTESHSQCIVDCLQYMQANLNEQELSVCGLEKREGETIIRNKTNGCPLGGQDCEHAECENYHQIKFTLPCMANSAQPDASKPWCHPLALRDDPPWDHIDVVEKVFKPAMHSFEQLSHDKWFSLPQIFCMVGENATLAEDELCGNNNQSDTG